MEDVVKEASDRLGGFGQRTILFIDEIQNISEWFLFVNRLLRQEMHILVTGSNAKLLSGELATHLTGRYSQIELYPFSFREYCEYKRLDTQALTTRNEGFIREAFDEYLKKGGFPCSSWLPKRATGEYAVILFSLVLFMPSLGQSSAGGEANA